MTNANFASLHAGMLQRKSTTSAYDCGKVVKTLPPSHLAPPRSAQPKNDPRRAATTPPPIRSLLDQVADWTALPSEIGAGFGKRYRDPVSEPSPPPPIVEAKRQDPENLDTFAHGQAPSPVAAPAEGSGVAVSEKPKRKALTFRLEPDSHRRLRRVSADLGRSCQSILFSAMNEYLTSLGFDEDGNARE